MTNSISVESLSVVYHSSIPVVTTELLSKLYGTDAQNVKKNFARNAERFTEGKHYFKLTGDELRAFKHKVTNCPFVKVAGNVRHLMLWTERGAARHAKMLETDQAWEVFEKLEDSYFSQKVSRSASKTTVDERTPLRDAINMLVSKKHLLYPEAYALIHQRFNVEHIDELASEDLPTAIEYVHRLALEGELLPKQTGTLPALSIPVRGVIAMHFDGSEIVRTEFVPEGATVATLDQFASLVRHRGGVILWDEMEQRAFVRERAMLRL